MNGRVIVSARAWLVLHLTAQSVFTAWAAYDLVNGNLAWLVVDVLFIVGNAVCVADFAAPSHPNDRSPAQP